MEAAAASASSSSLRALLRATARSCFGNGGFGERLRWRGRAGAEEFRYDPLSYALNFDEGDVPDVDGEEDRAAARRRGRRFVCRSFSSSQLMPASPRGAVEAA